MRGNGVAEVGTTLSGSSFTVTRGQYADYGMLRIVFAEPIDVTGKSTIKISIHTSSAINGNIIFLNSANDHKETYTNGGTENGYVTINLTLANYVVDGKLPEISIGLWITGMPDGMTIDIAGIAIV